MSTSTHPSSSLTGSEVDFGDSIDQVTFEQILEMDEDEDERDFSKGIVLGFFEQAEATFGKMDAALASSDLKELSAQGHFLKGSSATLGLTKVKDCCEKIQHYGHLKDEHGNDTDSSGHALTEKEALEKIKAELALLRKEYDLAEGKLRRFFGEEKEE